VSTSAVVAYAATASLPVAARAAGHSAPALPQRARTTVADTGRTGDPVAQVLLAAAARTRPRSPTLGTLIDTWA
jgi:hypothetical protein